MKKIKVYSSPICSHCTSLKEYLNANSIPFENMDVSQNDKVQDEMIKKSGQETMPVIDIDGEIIVGFDKKKIDELLDIKGC